MQKPIPGFPDYEITDDGRVWSCTHWDRFRRLHAGRWLQLRAADACGHLGVALFRNGHRKECKVHRLVLETFVGPCPAGMECCHKDGNPMNNRLDNLRWDTRQGNRKDDMRCGKAKGASGEHNPHARTTEREVREMRMLFAAGVTRRTLAERYGLAWPTVDHICKRRNWRHVV